MSTPSSPPRAGRPSWAASHVLILAVGALAVAMLAVGHAVGIATAASDAVVAGVVVSLAGVWMMAADRLTRTQVRWRWYLSTAMVIWGLGQTVIGVELALGSAGRIAVGDLISFLAAPFYLAGITRAVRSRAFVRPALRIVIDAVMVGSSVGLFVWRMAVDIGEFSKPVTAFATTIVFIDLVVAAFGLLVFIRRPSFPTFALAGGLAAFAVADLLVVLRNGSHGSVSTIAPAIYCIAMTVLAAVSRVIEPEPADGRDVRRDTREASGAVIITAVAIVADGIHVAVERDPSTWPPIVFVLLTIVAFFVRHLVDHQQRRTMFAQLRHQARTDPLTGVGNRFALDEVAEGSAGQTLDVVVVGLDGLPSFNDALGHREGDALVARVADVLGAAFPAALALVRLDSDEFAIVQAPVADQLAVAATAVDAADVAAHRSVESAARVRITAGVARGFNVDRGLFDAVGRAQRARHLARSTPGARVRLYDEAMLERDERERQIDQRLPGAIERDEITVHLQPVVSLATGRVVGVEALARWTDPVLGVVNPVEFIARAEATDQIADLGVAMLRRAVGAAVALGLSDRGISVAVNASVAQLRRADGRAGYAEEVAAVLARAGLPAQWLVVEVTESILVSEHDPAMDEIRALSAMGVRIAVDDFGSGYWALSYFRWFSADILKIERALVEALAHDERSRAVVASIVELCRRTGMVTVAEGIEDAPVAEAARALGVVNAQGWAYAKAVPADELLVTIDRIESQTLATQPS